MVRAKRLTGLHPLSYIGVDPVSPNDFVVQTRAPLTSDFAPYNLGDEWLNVSTNLVYKLVSKEGKDSIWSIITGGGAGSTTTYRTNSGDATPSADILRIEGGLNINTAGATNIVTINLNSTLVGNITFEGDITFNGGLTFPALGDGVLQSDSMGNITATEGTDGQVLISSTAGSPSWQNITSTGGTVSITNASNSINLETGVAFSTYTAVNTTPYTVLATDVHLGVDSSGGIISIELPNAPAAGRIFSVKDSTGSAATNNITVTTVGGAVNIDGATSYVMNTNFQAISVIFSGTAYEVI